jgi:hypothetical protein
MSVISYTPTEDLTLRQVYFDNGFFSVGDPSIDPANPPVAPVVVSADLFIDSAVLDTGHVGNLTFPVPAGTPVYYFGSQRCMLIFS